MVLTGIEGLNTTESTVMAALENLSKPRDVVNRSSSVLDGLSSNRLLVIHPLISQSDFY